MNNCYYCYPIAIDRYVWKGFWAKKSAQLVIPVRSTFQNYLHPPIGVLQSIAEYCKVLQSIKDVLQSIKDVLQSIKDVLQSMTECYRENERKGKKGQYLEEQNIWSAKEKKNPSDFRKFTGYISW